MATGHSSATGRRSSRRSRSSRGTPTEDGGRSTRSRLPKSEPCIEEVPYFKSDAQAGARFPRGEELPVRLTVLPVLLPARTGDETKSEDKTLRRSGGWLGIGRRCSQYSFPGGSGGSRQRKSSSPKTSGGASGGKLFLGQA